MTWLVLLFLNAQEFCLEQGLPHVACIEAFMECVLDDDQQYCAQEFWSYYEGQ